MNTYCHASVDHKRVSYGSCTIGWTCCHLECISISTGHFDCRRKSFFFSFGPHSLDCVCTIFVTYPQPRHHHRRFFNSSQADASCAASTLFIYLLFLFTLTSARATMGGGAEAAPSGFARRAVSRSPARSERAIERWTLVSVTWPLTIKRNDKCETGGGAKVNVSG